MSIPKVTVRLSQRLTVRLSHFPGERRLPRRGRCPSSATSMSESLTSGKSLFLLLDMVPDLARPNANLGVVEVVGRIMA